MKAGEAREQEQDLAVRKLEKEKGQGMGAGQNKQTKPQSLSPSDVLPPATLLCAKDYIAIPNSALDSGSHVQV